MFVKCDGWPLVLPDDNGIRPAGEPDECFYCRRKVGQPHGTRCVCVSSVVRYVVWMDLARPPRRAGQGKRVGFFTSHDPHHWTDHDCEFHKNESSWCADNAVDDIEWFGPADEQALAEYLEDEANCACTPLYFEFDEVVDKGPYVERPDQQPTDLSPTS